MYIIIQFLYLFIIDEIFYRFYLFYFIFIFFQYKKIRFYYYFYPIVLSCDNYFFCFFQYEILEILILF